MKFRPGIDPSENQIQMGIVKFFRTLKAYQRGWTMHSVPNQGRTRGDKIHAWKMGQVAGIGDLLFINPANQTHYMEIKRIDGEQQEAQVEFEKHCGMRDTPTPYEIARSVDEGVAILKKWGLLEKTQKKTGPGQSDNRQAHRPGGVREA
jgi:hypothetical protein